MLNFTKIIPAVHRKCAISEKKKGGGGGSPGSALGYQIWDTQESVQSTSIADTFRTTFLNSFNRDSL